VADLPENCRSAEAYEPAGPRQLRAETPLWEMNDLVEYIDSREAVPKKSGPYKKHL